MTRKQTFGALAAGLLLAMNSPFFEAVAKPMSSEECDSLRTERAQMKAKGVGAHMAKNAKWASENLNKEQLLDVARFVGVLEQIRFRCSQRVAGKKSKFGLHRSVPLPVRNSRRIEQKKKKVQALSAIISVVDGEGAVKPSSASAPNMRKSLVK